MDPTERPGPSNQHFLSAKEGKRITDKPVSRLPQQNESNKRVKALEELHAQWAQVSRLLKESMDDSTGPSIANVLLEMVSSFIKGNDKQKIISALQSIALHEKEMNEEIKRDVILAADALCYFNIEDCETANVSLDIGHSDRGQEKSEQCSVLNQLEYKLPFSSILKRLKIEKSAGNVAKYDTKAASATNRQAMSATAQYMRVFKKYLELQKKKHEHAAAELRKINRLRQ